MGRPLGVWSISLGLCLIIILLPNLASATLRPNYYADVCPGVETIVQNAITEKFKQTFVTVPATLRLFFHDCIVEGCDGSVLVASTEENKAEKDHPDNLSLAGDGFDPVIKAKAALDEIPGCKNKVSCADILALATRDVVVLAGGPYYEVELGRLDGLISTASHVSGKIPKPTFNLNQLTRLFAWNGSLSKKSPIDPSLNKIYATELREMCPINVDPRIAINMDPTTPRIFDNVYYKNLQAGKGLFTSDQVLYTDFRSRPIVNFWARNPVAFERAFLIAITKLGRNRVKTGLDPNGNIRHDCSVLN